MEMRIHLKLYLFLQKISKTEEVHLEIKKRILNFKFSPIKPNLIITKAPTVLIFINEKPKHKRNNKTPQVLPSEVHSYKIML